MQNNFILFDETFKFLSKYPNKDLKYVPEECLPQMTPFFNKMFDPESKLTKYFWKIRCQCYKVVEHRKCYILLLKKK